MDKEFIRINGAQTHNLKNISINIPKNKYVVVTGKSGSGKSTLIMDTLFRYAKKNYLGALSSKEFGSIDSADCEVNYIKNIQPPVAIEQRRKRFNNPRSTIGTLTNIDGYLKILFSTTGKAVCPICYKETDMELFCEECGCYAEEIKPRDFSPSTKEGMCLNCNGTGHVIEFTEKKLVSDKTITLEELWSKAKKNTFNMPSNRQVFEKLMEHCGHMWTDRYCDISEEFRDKTLYGSEEKFTIHLNKVANHTKHLGILSYMDIQYKKTVSPDRRKDLEYYLDQSLCTECGGGKLKQTSLKVSVQGKSYFEIQQMNLLELGDFIYGLQLSGERERLLKDVVSDIKIKVENICYMSVGYLRLDRQVGSLSGGELQRILISQHISSELTGIMYILDEPTMGLHDSDTKKVIEMIKKIRDAGNTVIVIEHDEEVIRSADYVIEIGPGAGKYGGMITAKGTLDEVLNNQESLTARYIGHRNRIRKIIPLFTQYIEVTDMNRHNLKNVKTHFPTGALTCITGVSGCGKSSMVKCIYDILLNKLKKTYNQDGKLTRFQDGRIEDIIYIDQNPIKGSSRSNLMTYIGFYDELRKIYSKEAQKIEMPYSKADFSVNVPGGRCEFCHGQGEVEIDMYFMKNEYMVCPECGGKRFKNDILDVKYKDQSISDVFRLSVEDACRIFNDEGLNETKKALNYLNDFGLGYLRLGQTTDSISGGEAQRIHLISSLMSRKNKNTLFIFDEPSSGLHFADIEYLIKLFDELIREGQTVLVIEHNLDIIYNSDFIIDLGPGAGDKGGTIVYNGKTEEFLQSESGITAECLKRFYEKYYIKSE